MKKILKIFVLISICVFVFKNSYTYIYATESEQENDTISQEINNLEKNQENSNRETTLETENVQEEYKGKVIKSISLYEDENDFSKYQKVIVEIDNEKYKGKQLEAKYLLCFKDGVEAKALKTGDIVYLIIQNDEVIVKDIYRLNYIFILVAIFLIIIILIGGLQGIKTAISLSITFLVIFFGFIPLIIKGENTMLVAVGACFIITIVTLILVSGFKKKTFVAMIGTATGVLVAFLIAVIFTNLANITGLGNEEAQMLVFISQKMKLDIFGLFFAGIIIATLGATMDIAMSIASTMNELEIQTNNKITPKELFKSGLNVGKDAMGTMSNTLILAYVGESLNIVILILLSGKNVIETINYDFIAAEILRSLCGTIGMISAIPITALVYAIIYSFKKGGNIKDIFIEEKFLLEENENKI